MGYPSGFIAVFLFLPIVLFLVKQWKRFKTVQKLPPGPRKLPIIGNMHQLIGFPPHHALRRLSQKHGALMHLQLGEISAIVISSPRLAKEIMKTHDLAFANRAEFLASKIINYNYSDIVSAPYGEYWRQMRKICTLELLSVKNVRTFGSIRQEEAKDLISSIQALAAAGELINVTEKVSSYTSSMVFKAGFGKVSMDHKNRFLQLLKESVPIATSFEVSDLFPSYKIFHPLSRVKPKLMKVHQEIDKIYDVVISEHENLARTKRGMGESANEDLIDVLLRVKESEDLQVPVTYNNIKSVMMDMFAGGTETSSTVVEWVMSELIRNPNVMAKAQCEIRTAFLGKKEIEEADAQELAYLKLVIKETLRLHPPLPLLIPRECREECEIDGYVIPIKTRVIVNIWAIGKDPEYWDDPESFKPERFENNPVDFTGKYFEYLPFGAGRRICPGISFGLANVELPLALLLYYFDWKLPDGFNSSDLDMTETIGIAAARKNNLCLLATLYDPDMAFQSPNQILSV